MSDIRWNIFDYPSVNSGICIVHHNTFESICCAYSDLPESKLEDWSWPGNGNITGLTYQSFKNLVYKYPQDQCWGFFRFKYWELHVWFSLACSTRNLMALVAHELGHSMERKKKKYQDSEEVKASRYEDVTRLAWDLTYKLQREKNYGV